MLKQIIYELVMLMKFMECSTMDKNYLVTKSNYFIMNSHYDLSLEEQKLILTLASMVQPQDTEFKEYEFKIKNFIELLGVKDQSRYTEVPKITKELMKKVFEIREGKDILQLSWLSSARYKTGEGIVILKFDSNLKPYMLQLGTEFTKYKLANILSMKSKYSPRMYEFLKCNEFKKQGYIEIEVAELRKLLKAENIYPMYNDFKRKIIMQTQKELKKLADISFEFEEIKTGRKVTSIKFTITSKANNSKNTCINEIAVCADGEEQQQNNGDDINIKLVQGIISETITDMAAKKIYEFASGDIERIKEKYNIVNQLGKVGNIVGAMIRALQEDWTTTKAKGNGNIPKGSFNDYEQRTYDFEELEKKLLGWDN
jgi:plasmid replication initiation protein